MESAWLLGRYGFSAGEGLYTDMIAIRRDEEFDNLHSVYVDQWDWEIVITKEQRNLDTLKNVVNKIYGVFKKTENYICSIYPNLTRYLSEDISFVTTQELEDLYTRHDTEGEGNRPTPRPTAQPASCRSEAS
jgi:aspartate--ammonia ligase